MQIQEEGVTTEGGAGGEDNERLAGAGKIEIASSDPRELEISVTGSCRRLATSKQADCGSSDRATPMES